MMLATGASALACLAVVATLQQAGASSATLYVCQNGQCVPNPRGLPLSECEAACAPPPNANYTCQSGQCVISPVRDQGLPKAQCARVCSAPGPPPGPTAEFICQQGYCVPCTGDECVSKADCAQACGSTSIVARVIATKIDVAFKNIGGRKQLNDFLG